MTALHALQFLGAAASLSRGFAGLGEVFGPANRWDRFSLGVEIDGTSALPHTSSRIVSEIHLAIAKSGLTTGYTQVYQLAGTWDPFIVVEGTIAGQWNTATDFKNALLRAIESPGYQAYRDTVRFEFQPVVNDVPQTPQRYDGPAGGRSTADRAADATSNENYNVAAPKCPYEKSLFCKCGYEFSLFDFGCVPIGEDSMTDTLARKLGVTPTQAAALGFGAAIVGLFLLKRAL